MKSVLIKSRKPKLKINQPKFGIGMSAVKFDEKGAIIDFKLTHVSIIR
jgi:hypothetical protein